jgi:hypothetical protein
MLFRIKAGDREFYLVRASERPDDDAKVAAVLSGLGLWRAAPSRNVNVSTSCPV